MQALDMLLFNMHKLLPSPEHEASTLAEDANGEPVELHCTEDEPTAAYVFKTVADPFVGKLSYLRVISGKVTARRTADQRPHRRGGKDHQTPDRPWQEADGERRHRCRRYLA